MFSEVRGFQLLTIVAELAILKVHGDPGLLSGTQLTFTWSKSAIGTVKKGVKYV